MQYFQSPLKLKNAFSLKDAFPDSIIGTLKIHLATQFFLFLSRGRPTCWRILEIFATLSQGLTFGLTFNPSKVKYP